MNCSKTSVLIDTVVSSVSVTSSPSFTVQVTGVAPTIQLDSTDGGQIYLSQAAADVVEITVAKCSAINVSVPEKNEKGEDIQAADLANDKGVVFFLVPKAETRTSVVFGRVLCVLTNI